MLKKLTDIGFKKVGKWYLADTCLQLELVSEADSSNVLYSFVVGDEPKYVGKTTQRLKKRMYGYLNPGPTQTTNIRNNANLTACLEEGVDVAIYVLPDHGLLHFGDFHLNLAAGLEDSIVSSLKPVWNMTGKKNR